MMKNKLLELLSIKLTKENHKIFSQYLKIIAYAAFLVILSVGLFNKVNTWISSSEILAQGKTEKVEIFQEEVYEKEKTFYYYRYEINVTGKTIVNKFFATKSMRELWGNSSKVDFKFLPSNPENARPVVTLMKDTNVVGFVKWLALLVFVASICVWLFYTFITAVVVVPKNIINK